MFTQRHYVWLAQWVKTLHFGGSDASMDNHVLRAVVAADLANQLDRAESNFKWERFIAACGVDASLCDRR